MRISDWSSDVCSSVLLAAPLAVETQWRAGRRKEFAARGSRAAAGKLFSPDGCSHEARGAATPPPGFTTGQGRFGPNRSERGTGQPSLPARRLLRLGRRRGRAGEAAGREREGGEEEEEG